MAKKDKSLNSSDLNAAQKPSLGETNSYDLVPLPYQCLNSEGFILSVNKAWLDMLGYKAEEVVGTWIGSYVTQESQELLGSRFQQFKREGSVLGIEYIFIHKDGHRLLLSINGQIEYDNSGGVRQTHCILNDITDKRRSEKQLADSERQFRGLFETSIDGIVFVDKWGVLRDVNPAFCTMLGTTRNKLLGRNVRDIVSDDFFQFSWATFNKILSGAKAAHDDLKVSLIHDEGFRIPASVRFWTTGTSDDVEGAWAMIKDISKALQTEEALRKSESRYRRIVETANEGIIGLDASQTIVFFNQVMADFLGYDREELLGRPVGDIFLPQEQDRRIRQIAMLDNDTGQRYETPFLRKDGSQVWGLVSSTRLRSDSGEDTGSFAMIADITEVYTATREMERAHSRLLSILDGIDADIYVSELDGTEILFLNAHMRASFNVSEDTVNCHEIFQEKDRPCGRCPKPHLLDENGHPIRTTISEGYNSITNRWYLKHDRAIEWLEGKWVHMHMAADITELKKLEKSLTHAMSEAEAANVAKTEFLANMSHEIRTPLNGLLGMLQVLQLTSLDEEQRDHLNTALESGRSLLQILNDILDLSKIESKKMEFEEENTELGEVLNAVVSVFRHEARTRGVEVTWKIDESLPRHFLADKGRLRQVLFNLVGNATKFTESGSVTVEAYPLPIPKKDGRTHVYFSVTDTGIGIPEDKIDLMFAPFTQVDGSATRKYQGTGLGLDIVHRLVSMMDGNIAVSSTEGEGTSIVFTVALKPGAEPASQQASPQEETEGELTILVAEDERVNRVVAHRLLSQKGHRVICAEDGNKALEILRNGRKFDCILMDIQMPGRDGVETTGVIRKDLRLDVPIIALTAHAMKGDQSRFLEAGMNGYVAKPFEQADLLREIKRVVEEKTG